MRSCSDYAQCQQRSAGCQTLSLLATYRYTRPSWTCLLNLCMPGLLFQMKFNLSHKGLILVVFMYYWNELGDIHAYRITKMLNNPGAGLSK